MSLQSTNRIKSLIDAISARTGYTHLDLKSAFSYLCRCFNDTVGNETITEYDTSEQIEAVNTLKSVLNEANNTTGINSPNLTASASVLCNAQAKQTPLYSFGAVSDIHIQYDTGYTDFQRALNYFEKQNLSFACVCGDLTWAGTMVNASQYTNQWKGGLADYADIVGNRVVYPIGGNHECYTATYDSSSKKWTSVGGSLNVSDWTAKTGVEPYYTISSSPTNASTHNVYNSAISPSDVFIMLSMKTESAPNLWLDGEWQWLQNTLEANKNKRCFVFFHVHDNADKTADAYGAYPHGVSENTAQGKAFIDLMRHYRNAIWFHGHTHTTFNEEYPSVGTTTARGYKTVNIPSLQGARDYNEDGSFVGMATGSEGYVIEVYDGYLVLKALEFSSVNQDGTGAPALIEAYVLDTTLELVE